MPLYRCAPPSEFDGLQPPRRQPRPPGNVPYVVDNLWEWLRPGGLPSRRFAVFASPSAELARAGATGGGRDASGFRVGQVEFQGEVRLAQAPWADARHHPDIARLRSTLLQALGPDWPARPLAEKWPSGALFLPTLTASDTDGVLAPWPGLATRLREASTFWCDVRPIAPGEPLPFAEGEVFFEAPGGWRLVPA